MKKILISLTIFLMLFSLSIYAKDSITVLIDGQTISSDAPAQLVASRTMLPFRAIFNALGVSNDSIKWHQDSKSIEISINGKYIFLMVGNKGAIVNDNLITLDAAPFVENGRTFVPIRFISEALGADVQWDSSTQTVKIKTN